MAMAYAAALPGALEKAIAALGLSHPKDKIGQTLMRRMSKPASDGSWVEDAESLARLCEYCRRDVEAERALSKALPPLTDDEQKLWVVDQIINDRGFAVDAALLEAAQRVVVETEAKLQAEFRDLTELDSTNQTAKLIAWLAAHDCNVTDVQKGTLHHALRRKGLTPDARRAIELRMQLAHASAVKVEALLAWRGADNRVRGSLTFHGASTGRWIGRGPQPQNFKRDSEGIDTKITAIMNGGAELDSPVEAVGDIARAMIVAAPGHRLLIGDFSGIESRVIAWISGQLSKLDQWAKFDRTGALADDPYFIQGCACGLAKDIARAKGKICDLAFGYQGGLGAWKAQAPTDDPSTDADIKRYQHSWRKQHPYTVAFWHGVDDKAIAAVRTPGKIIEYKRLRFVYEGNFLRITLPSGRALSYPFPRIERGKYGYPRVMFKDASGGKWADCGHGHGAYGGLWTENIVSAIARDLLASAMQRLEVAGYPIVLTVHDEIVCEVPDGFGNLEEFRSIITAKPDWVTGVRLPIAAKVRESARFSKSDAGVVVSFVWSESVAESAAETAVELDDLEPADQDDELDALLDAAGGADRGDPDRGDPDRSDPPWSAPLAPDEIEPLLGGDGDSGERDSATAPRAGAGAIAAEVGAQELEGLAGVVGGLRAANIEHARGVGAAGRHGRGAGR
jgi:DNA polymerase bacteriophage-type